MTQQKKAFYQNKYVGKTYNYLTIISRNDEYKKLNNIKSKAGYYLCQCKCGNYKTVRITALTSGEVKSCGCLKKQLEKTQLVHGFNLYNLIGQQFGNLKVIQKSNVIKDQAYWICQCQCGNKVTVRSSSLRNGHTTSCGCKKMSKNEKQIASILHKNNIIFLYDKPYFPDLKLSNNTIGRYDFILFQNEQPYRIIQYDGQQHIKDAVFFGKNKLQEIQANDLLKNNYAKQHNIPLVRIPYNIIPTYENLMSDQFLI